MSTKLSTTTIQGLPREYNAEELEALQDIEVNAYLNTSRSKHWLRCPLLQQFLTEFAELYMQGYRLADLPLYAEPLSCSAYLTKPDSVLVPELEQIREDVRARYIQELQDERERYKSALVQQLKEAADAKERTAAEQKAKKQQKEYEEQADACFGELVVPD